MRMGAPWAQAATAEAQEVYSNIGLRLNILRQGIKRLSELLHLISELQTPTLAFIPPYKVREVEAQVLSVLYLLSCLLDTVRVQSAELGTSFALLPLSLP